MSCLGHAEFDKNRDMLNLIKTVANLIAQRRSHFSLNYIWAIIDLETQNYRHKEPSVLQSVTEPTKRRPPQEPKGIMEQGCFTWVRLGTGTKTPEI